VEDEKAQNALRRLQTFEEVLAIINNHLASGWGVDSSYDGSHYEVEFLPVPEASRSGRKRRGGRRLHEFGRQA